VTRYDGPWTLPAMLADRAEVLGQRVAVATAEGEALSYAQLADRAARFAAGLVELGVAPGDRVATMLDPGSPYLAAWFGTAWTGAIEVPVNTSYKGGFLTHVLNESEASVVVMDGRWLPRLDGRDLPYLQHLVVLDGAGRPGPKQVAVHGMDDLLGFEPLAPTPISEYDAAAIMYTSGTTGASKGVLHSHRSALRNTVSAVEVAGFDADDVAYSFFPLFHVTARAFVISSALWTGGRVLLRDRFSVSDFWADVITSGVTWFAAMGSVLHMLLSHPPGPPEGRQRIRLVCAGAVPGDLAQRFTDRFGAEVLDIYGLTETGVVTAQRPGRARPGTTGAPMPHFEVAIHDQHGWPAKPGAIGEICIRPAEPHALFRGYWRRPEATAEAFRDLWFRTGDAGRLDGQGELVFVDRIKDAIRRRGENISSFEVERVITDLPGVAECAAYAVPSELGEDEVMVAVVASSDLDVGELFQQCIEYLPRFAVPRYVRMMVELPKTPSQRVQKVRLRAEGVTTDAVDRGSLGIIVPHD
jgi:carnitine-CoA ligase